MSLKAYFNLNLPALVNFMHLDVKKIFEKSIYVKAINSIDENSYEIIFSWKKFGITKDFPVIVEEFKDLDSYLVENLKNSRYNFKISISSVKNFKNNEINTKIVVNAEMGAGLLADMFGQNDFKSFIQESVISAIKTYAIEIKKSNTVDSYEEKNMKKILELEQYLETSLVEKIASQNWQEANQEVTCILTKKIDDLNYWLIKAYISEKCNLQKLAEVYLNYIKQKDNNILRSKLAIILSEDSDILKKYI